MKPFDIDQEQLRELVREPGVVRQFEAAGAKVRHCEVELKAEIGDEVRFNVKEVLVEGSSIQRMSVVEIILWYPKRFRVARPDVTEEFKRMMQRMGYEVRGSYPIIESHGLRLIKKTTGSTEAVIRQALEDLPQLKKAQAQLVQYFDDEVARGWRPGTNEFNYCDWKSRVDDTVHAVSKRAEFDKKRDGKMN